MLTAEQNYRLLEEIEENRRFLLMAYRQNPMLLASAELRVRQLFECHAADWRAEPGGKDTKGRRCHD